MTVAQLLQTTPPQRLEALQERFSRGGSWEELILPLAGFATLSVVLVVFYSLQRRRQRVDIDHPQKLYRRLVQRLGLSAQQRDLLYRMASDLGLENPSVLLLGRRIFEAQARRWRETCPAGRRGDDRRFEVLASKLFPTE
jgi:hypothetical protein